MNPISPLNFGSDSLGNRALVGGAIVVAEAVDLTGVRAELTTGGMTAFSIS